MGERSRKAPRCAHCRMLQPLCICPLLTPLQIRTQVICVLHKMEDCKPTNTGRLVTMMLDRGECRVRGERGAQLDTHDFAEPSRRTLMLFPSEQAQLLCQDFLAVDPRPIRLIVPDATWKQASRLSRKVELATAERVALPFGKASTYRLRRHARADALSTYEAVMEALCTIEGEHLREPLERVFRIFVDRTLWSRGELKANEVAGGISAEVAQWKNSSQQVARPRGAPGLTPEDRRSRTDAPEPTRDN